MRKHLAAAATLAILSPVANAQSTDSGMVNWSDLHGTIGVRVWRTDWSTWYDTYDYRHAQLETPVIPVASLRYKDFLVSGSYMMSKKFQFPDTAQALKRKEYDVNLGYFLYPGLAATVGWKTIDYEHPTYSWEAKGLTFGLSGSAPISPRISIYGNVAYGRPKLQDHTVPVGRESFVSVRGKYLLTEVGLAFPLSQFSDTLGGVVVTAGYRYQRVGAVPNFTPQEVFEYTQGPVLGISLSL